MWQFLLVVGLAAAVIGYLEGEPWVQYPAMIGAGIALLVLMFGLHRGSHRR
jgi:hypothetical protein